MSPETAFHGREDKIDFETLSSHFVKDSTYAREQTWAPICCSVILGFGKLDKRLIEDLVIYLLSRTETLPESNATPEILAIFRRLREGFLKASALVGFPRSINALSFLQASLATHAPSVSQTLKEDKSLRASIPLSERQSRGRAFFSTVYGKHAEKILSNLNESSGGDLGEFAINCVYGDLVSETSVLGEKETELLQFVCCLAFGVECAPQAKGHMYGSKTLGNTGEDIRGAIRVVEYLADVLNVPWRREDMAFLEKPNEW